jgi:hypothetical protein
MIARAGDGSGGRPDRLMEEPQMPAKWIRIFVSVAVLGMFAVVPAVAETEEEGKAETTNRMTRCSITFDLKGWSALYKTMKGEGKITCDNGQTAEVTIKTTGGGFTAGKSELTDASGNFSKVKDISETFGGYAQAEAHAGAVGSSGAQALTKGEVSLALAGTGRGFDLGISFGKFTIRPKDESAATDEPEDDEDEPESVPAKEIDS